MECRKCMGKTKVLSTKLCKDGRIRIRECEDCKIIFASEEKLLFYANNLTNMDKLLKDKKYGT